MSSEKWGAGATASAAAGSRPYARAALERGCSEVARTTSGRNAALNATAFALGQLSHAGALREDEVTRHLLEAAEACGYIAKDGRPAALATIRSGFRRGTLSPRDIPQPSRSGKSDAAVPSVDPAEAARRERARELARLAHEAEVRIKAEGVRRLWDRAVDPRGTLVERYLAEHRSLDLPDEACGRAVRFLADGPLQNERGPLMLCAFRDLVSDEVCGLHRTLLDAQTGAKRDRGMLGRAKGAAVKLSPDEAVSHGLFVAEGVESALAGMMIGLRPMWALGSTVNIKSFPILDGIECLTICGETGEASAKVVEECGSRWTAAGREVRVSYPTIGSDLNDSLRGAA